MKTAAAVALGLVIATLASAMTNEEVVRRTMKGESPQQIIEAILAAPATAFDVDPEVIVELREAGVADEVIEAMRKATPAAAPPPAEPRVPLRVDVTLRLLQPGKSADQPPVDAPPRVEVPVQDRDGHAIRAALFLICLDPRHVPDGWTLSPLAEHLPRHHLIWFSDRTRPADDTGGGPPQPGPGGGAPGAGDKAAAGRALVLLDLPSSIPLAIEAGDHPVRLGLALRVGEGPWMEAGEASGRLSLAEGTPVTLTAIVSGRLTGRRTRSSGYTLRIAGSEPAGAWVAFPASTPTP